MTIETFLKVTQISFLPIDNNLDKPDNYGYIVSVDKSVRKGGNRILHIRTGNDDGPSYLTHDINPFDSIEYCIFKDCEIVDFKIEVLKNSNDSVDEIVIRFNLTISMKDYINIRTRCLKNELSKLEEYKYMNNPQIVDIPSVKNKIEQY